MKIRMKTETISCFGIQEVVTWEVMGINANQEKMYSSRYNEINCISTCRYRRVS